MQSFKGRRKVCSVLVLTAIMVQLLVSTITMTILSTDSVVKPLTLTLAQKILEEQKLSRRCFVCITGQIQRLELKEKVLHILQPLKRAGIIPDVALVVSDDTMTRFSNDRGQEHKEQIYHNYQQASDYLAIQGFTVLTQESFKQCKNPHVPASYINKMDNKTESFTKEKQIHRSRNHYRQFESLKQCGTIYTAAAASVKYAFVIRARDDLGFQPSAWNGTTSNLTSVLRELYRNPNTILGSDCRTHGGINDRFAWVSPQAALLYFQIPLATMTGQLAISKQTKNPESFLLYSYLGANITVRVTPKLRGLMKLVISSKSTTKFNDGELEKRFCPEDSMTGGFQRYLLNPQARFPWMQRYHPKKLHQSHTAISNVTCSGSRSRLP